ncbi:hypothetical protein E4U53_000898 [Claviceps sorghi]|nr:hypothetical protein E4U53_000898 [Claviceps sorghi]
MASVYKQFLASPSSSYLSEKASLHYITTTTSVYGATEIIKHLNTLQKQVKTKKQELLHLVDGQSVIAAEVDTTLEFQTSGGAYLPGLDDNFLSDRVAYLSIIHIVTFDEAGKILQIRQQWDQGSLLKQVEIIGKSGRNWPIRDSREQLTLIQSCLKSSGVVQNTTPNSHNDMVLRTRGNSTNAMRDPHASLQLFGNREELEAAQNVTVVSPYAGKQRRGERSFTDVLGDDPSGEHYHAGHNGHPSTASPSKVGQGKNVQPMRIFEGQEYVEEEDQAAAATQKRFIRPNPQKYSHFDLVDGSDPQDKPKPGVALEKRPKSKHDSQWDFEDFSTPSKHQPTKQYRARDRQWDTEASGMEDDAQNKPTQHGSKGRRDAETHFELQDDGERLPHQDRPNTRPRGSMHNDNLGLYKNKLFDRDDATPEPHRALGNITNLGGRGKDFDPHFAMADESPAPTPSSRNPHVPEGRMKAVKQMDANWSSYDQSPIAQKENKPRGEGRFLDDNKINIAGDGMGGRKGTSRDWLYGGADDETPKPAPRKTNTLAAQKGLWD